MVFVLFCSFFFCFFLFFVVVVCLASGYAQPRLRLFTRSWYCCVLFEISCLRFWGCHTLRFFILCLLCGFGCGFVSFLLRFEYCVCLACLFVVFCCVLFYCDGVCVVFVRSFFVFSFL